MFVYKITNTINSRLYVGLTTHPLNIRWNQHKCAAKLGADKPLYRAMRKHGIDNFSIHLLYTARSIDDLRAAELRYIEELKTHVNDGGYNLTDHGHRYGCATQLNGEKVYNSKLTEQVVAFIRSPDHWDKTNKQMLEIVSEMFGFHGSHDAIRDARRGDVWKHLNQKYPPIRVGQGKRRLLMSEEKKALAVSLLKSHHAEAVKKSAQVRSGKRSAKAKLPEHSVVEIFNSPCSLAETAKQHGISKKMVLLIKQRKAHVYLTKDL